VDFVDDKNTYINGHLALQQHGPAQNGPDTVLHVRKIEIKELIPNPFGRDSLGIPKSAEV
jgi:hypothetical protein